MTRILPLAAIVAVLFAEPTWACKNRRVVVLCPTMTPVQPIKPMAGAEGVLLRFNFEQGRFYQELDTVTKQYMKVMDQELSQVQRQTWVLEWTPLGKDSQGNWLLKQKIVGAKMEIDIGGNKIEYDSEGHLAPLSPVDGFFKQLMSLELIFTLDADYQILKITGREQFVDALAKASPSMKSLLEKILSDNAVKGMAQPAFDPLPNRTVRRGETWTRRHTIDLGPVGIYRTEMRYRYDGPSKGLEKIDVQSDCKFEKPAKDSALPFVIKKGSLKSTKGDGEVLYDSAKGRIVSSTMNMIMQGELTLEVGGVDTVVVITQNQTSLMRVTDQNPLRKRN